MFKKLMSKAPESARKDLLLTRKRLILSALWVLTPGTLLAGFWYTVKIEMDEQERQAKQEKVDEIVKEENKGLDKYATLSKEFESLKGNISLLEQQIEKLQRESNLKNKGSAVDLKAQVEGGKQEVVKVDDESPKVLEKSTKAESVNVDKVVPPDGNEVQEVPSPIRALMSKLSRRFSENHSSESNEDQVENKIEEKTELPRQRSNIHLRHLEREKRKLQKELND